MNIKWMALIIIVLVLGLTAMVLFVPQQLQADGSIKYFGKKDQGGTAPVMDTVTKEAIAEIEE